MKIQASCIKCKMKERAEITVTNDNVYEVTCSKGHTWQVLFNCPRHELLFDMGMNAIVDGYYRESIVSFSASLERYYEFVIKAFHPQDDFNKIWNLVASQSERQLGAYIFTYYSFFKEKPKLLSRSSVELRNKVVHKGYIATREEAINYGKKVSEIIINGCCLIKEQYEPLLFNIIKELMTPTDENANITHNLGVSTFLNFLSNRDDHFRSFEDYLNLISKNN